MYKNATQHNYSSVTISDSTVSYWTIAREYIEQKTENLSEKNSAKIFYNIWERKYSIEVTSNPET